MENYITKEYIELCEKIQHLIEPEVGMLCVFREFPLNNYIITFKKLGEVHLAILNREAFNKIKIEKIKRYYVIIPDLMWLVRVLEKESYGIYYKKPLVNI